MSEKTVSLPVYLTTSDRDAIKQAAETLGAATAADLVRDAISEYLVKRNQAPISKTISKRRGGNRRVIEQAS